MPLQKQKGNMYPWVTHMWNCVLGACPNECPYCYVKTGHWTQNNPMYRGKQRFNTRDDDIDLGTDKIIFVAHTNDLFTASSDIIIHVLKKCIQHNGNTYVFQTKNPQRAYEFSYLIPDKSIIGTTVETDYYPLAFHCAAPPLLDRIAGIERLKKYGAKLQGFKTFITIEPIIKFSPYFAHAIIKAAPDFINIGADSKKCKLDEPSARDIKILIEKIQEAGIEIRRKTNLNRLLGDEYAV